MLAEVKQRCHRWQYVNAYRLSHRLVRVHECKMCKAQKLSHFDSLTHSHIKTEYIDNRNGAVSSKTPDCIMTENILF